MLDRDRHRSGIDERVPSGLGGRWYGVYPALVTDIKDPDGQGRVKVTLPWSRRHRRSAIRSVGAAGDADGRQQPRQLVRPRRQRRSAGGVRGRRPAPARTCSAASGTAATRRRESMDGAGNNYKKVLRSRNGVKVTLDDRTARRSSSPKRRAARR